MVQTGGDDRVQKGHKFGSAQLSAMFASTCLAVAVTACSAASRPPATPPVTASAKSAAPSTGSRLRSELLTPAELGQGFQASGITSSANDALAFPGCPSLSGPVEAPHGSASALYRSGTTSLVEVLTSGVLGQLNADVSQTASAASQCKKFTGQVGGYKLTFMISPLTIPALGNRRTAISLTGTLSGVQALTVDEAAIRRHGVLLTLSYSTALRANPHTFDSLLDKAYAKLASQS
jgi:hypothetical protein